MYDPHERMNQILLEVNRIQNRADAENRDLTDEETDLIVELAREQRRLTRTILENPFAV